MIYRNLQYITLFLIFVTFAANCIHAITGKDHLTKNHLTKKTKHVAAELSANNLHATETKIGIYKLDKTDKKSTLHKKQNKKRSVHKKQPKTEINKGSINKKSSSKPAHRKETSKTKSEKAAEEDE
uniref:Secreted protein n=1 Tax=Strongyloides papillosus TaxID=174720 RepID=A0A0N5BLD1_STREA